MSHTAHIFNRITKRDGSLVEFHAQKITQAIAASGKASGEFDERIAAKLSIQMLSLAQQTLNHRIPTAAY